MRRAKPVPIPPVSRFELVLIVKAAIAASGRTDLTFQLDPEGDAVVESFWLLTVRTAMGEVDFLVAWDGWDFLREDEMGYFEDLVEMPRLAAVFRDL